MKRTPSRPRRGAIHRLGTAAALFLALASPACAQGGGQEKGRPAAGGAARSAVSRDSLVSRANESRLKGSAQAPVTLVEISDFQCPYCGEFARETYAKIDSAYIRTGKVKMLFVNLPLPNHAQAWSAAEAALCAGAQGQFWPMHDRIFATQREWSGQEDAPRRFARFAAELKLDAVAFRECTESDMMAPLILGDVMQAAGTGLTGTPSFILNGREAMSGALPFEEFRKRIDPLLAQPQPQPAPVPGTP